MNEDLDTTIEEELTGISSDIVSIRTPKLDPLQRLYVRAFLSTHSHSKAHAIVEPSRSSHTNINKYSENTAVQYHISAGLMDKMEALSITPELVVEKLYKEATREGNGANHAARVTALTTLGKHLRMFEDKKEDKSVIFNVINYATDKKLDIIEDNNTITITDTIEKVKLDDNISITNYNTESNDDEIYD